VLIDARVGFEIVWNVLSPTAIALSRAYRSRFGVGTRPR
jgi:hypothetical protein